MTQKPPKVMPDNFSKLDKHAKAMHMRFNGAKYSAISAACGVSEQRVRVWFMRGGPLHDKYEQFCREALSVVPGLEVRSVAETISDEAPKSVKTISTLRDKKSVNPATRYMCAKDLLDRAGYAPVQKTANVHIVEEMSSEELNRTFSGFLEAARQKSDNKRQKK